jgi:hypothetical protein
MNNQICGGGVMETQLAFQLVDGGSNPTSPLQFSFEVIKAISACELNAKWHSRFPEIHWSNVVRNKHYICYVAKFEGEFFAVAIWSSPIAANRLKDGQKLLELRRMAINDQSPKNTASRMLSWMRKDLKKRFPDILRLISYQDTEAHYGTIYKASGWHIANEPVVMNWNTSKRKRNAAQSSAPKIRWEYNLK